MLNASRCSHRLAKTRLLNLLKNIENQGDRDEGSYKHVLHGLTALYHRGSWEKCEDYRSPGRSMNDNIRSYWEEVVEIFDKIDKKSIDEIFEGTNYSCHYRMELYRE